MPRTTFLNGRSYDVLRGALAFSLSETGYRLTQAGTSDSGGDSLITWGTAGTVACRVESLTGGEALVGAKLSDRSTHLITLPPNTAVSHNDRFLIGTDTYEITAVRTRTAEFARHIEAVQVS